jgi:hypothetical protein
MPGDKYINHWFQEGTPSSYKIQIVYVDVPQHLKLEKKTVDTPFRFRDYNEAAKVASEMFSDREIKIVGSGDEPHWQEPEIQMTSAQLKNQNKYGVYGVKPTYKVTNNTDIFQELRKLKNFSPKQNPPDVTTNNDQPQTAPMQQGGDMATTFDEAGYPYVQLAGQPHRVSILSQKGGADPSFEEIEQGFIDPERRNPLVWKKGYDSEGNQYNRWDHQYVDWYSLLNANPEYLIRKCEQRHPISDAVKDALRGPNRKNYYMIKPLRTPRYDETLGDNVFNPILDPELKKRVEDYEAESVRGGEYKAYTEGNIIVPEDRIEREEQIECALLTCLHPRYVNHDDQPLMVDKKMYNLQDLDRIMKSPYFTDLEKEKYQHCAAKNRFCRSTNSDSVPIVNGPFKRINNSGGGACLFVAGAQYYRLVQDLKTYPDYQNNTVPEAKYNTLKIWRIGSKESFDFAAKLRQDIVTWLSEHLDDIIYSSEPTTIKEAMALSLVTVIDMDTANLLLSGIQLDTNKLYNKFIFSHRAAAVKLQLTRSNNSNLADKLMQSYGLISSMNIHITTDPTLKEPIFQYVDYLAQHYLDAMKIRSTYGGNIETFAMSQILKCNVFTWISDGFNYDKLDYQSFTYPNTNDTIHLFNGQRVAKGNVTGNMHYEILFPWKGESESESKSKLKFKSKPNLLNHLPSTKTEFDQLYPNLDKIKPDALNDALHTLLRLSLSSRLYDKMDKYRVIQWIKRIMISYPDKIDIPSVIHNLFLLAIRNIRQYPTMEERIMNNDDLIIDGVVDDLLVTLILIFAGIDGDFRDMRSYNQVLADAMIALGSDVVYEQASMNIETLQSMIVDHEDDPIIVSLRSSLIHKILARSTTVIYYYMGKDMDPPRIYPDSPVYNIDDLLARMLKYNDSIYYDDNTITVPDNIMLIQEPPEEQVVDESDNEQEEQEEQVVDEPEEQVVDEPEEQVVDEPEEQVVDEPEEQVVDEPEEQVVDEPEEQVVDEPEEQVDEPEDIDIEDLIIQLNDMWTGRKKSIQRVVAQTVERQIDPALVIDVIDVMNNLEMKHTIQNYNDVLENILNN